MATTSERARSATGRDDGVGWQLFAGMLLVVVGAFNCVDGLVAISNANYFSNVTAGTDDLPITDNVRTWGWVVLIAGVVMIAAGFGVFSGAMWARIAAIVIIAVNMLMQFTYLAHFPLWSFTMILLDVMVIYALAVKVQDAPAR
jgi:hypothetical protein